MLLESRRKEIIAQHPGLGGLDDVVEKEILLHDILATMHQGDLLDGLCFIGGTALRLCHNASRLSEDLDFAADIGFDKERLADLPRLLEDTIARKYAVEVFARESKTLGDTLVWKITVTKNPADPSFPAQKLHIDISRYPALSSSKMPIIDHYGSSPETDGVFIRCLSLQESMADKMLALAFRQRRIKPRDAWDIVWLTQQGGTVDAAMALKKLELRGIEPQTFAEALRVQTLRLGDAETHSDFDAEMRRFIPGSTAKTTLDHPDFWPYLTDTIKRQADLLQARVMDIRMGGSDPSSGMRM